MSGVRGIRMPRGAVSLAALGVVAALAAALSLRIPFRAWPEVLVPSYLFGRGWLLYRDIKIVHAPLLIGAVAAVSRTVGLNETTLRVAGFLPVAAILATLRRHGARYGWGIGAQTAAQLVFVLTFFAWDGNAIYPEVFLAVLAVPIYAALRRGGDAGVRLAGWLFGVALAIKQPAVFAFLLASIGIALQERRRLLSFILRAGAVPAACLLAFLAAGEGADFLRWTIEVPLAFYRGRTSLGIQPAQAPAVLVGALPLLAWIVFARRHREGRGPAFLLPGLTLAFAMPAFPHFEMVHLVAAVPLLAVAAGEVVAEGAPRGGVRGGAAPAGSGDGRREALPAVAGAVAVGVSVLLNAAFLATDTSAGEMSFWSSKPDEAALARLSALPPAPLFLYGADQNLFVRSGRVPPGHLYSNPDLWVHYLVDDLERKQVRILQDHPETIVLRGPGTPIETPRRLLPAYLAALDASEEFVPGWIRRLRLR
ncbi:MAG: hypothetical protein ACRD16_12135 [Thermoanaerobaculia bacterium]